MSTASWTKSILSYFSSSTQDPPVEASKSSKDGDGYSPKDIASSDNIEGLRLSKDGELVVYTVGPRYKTGDHPTSALWVAETFTKESACQITTGEYHDFSPTFHPTSSKILFLSDRRELGKPAHLYSLTLHDKEITRIGDIDGDYGVASYSISPSGDFLAFTLEKKPKPDDKEMIKVWRSEETYTTLHLIDLRESSSGYSMRTLVSVDAHVNSFSWSPDSSAIAYRLLSHNDFESHFFPVEETIISISSAEVQGTFEYARLPQSPTIWRENGHFAFIQPSDTTAPTLSSLALWTRPSSGSSPATRFAYGITNDAENAVDLGTKSQYAVSVAEGLITKIDIYDENNKPFTAFRTSLEFSISTEWDMVLTEEGKYVFVVKRSSAVLGEPEDVWAGVTEFGKEGMLSTKLSSHHAWFDSKLCPVAKAFFWTGKDGVKLEGLVSYPRGVEPKNLPTVIVAHGGPYHRDTLALAFTFAGWRPFLASHGYLVLSPNYRGSSGRGEEFARNVVGTRDWDDIEAMLESAISQGLADPKRVGLAGYSQGGFETAWGITRPDNKFKVGVVGAGISDWGFMAASSDLPDIEGEISGSSPWTPGDPLYLNGSPIKDAKNVKAAVLILHGKADARVPLTQAIGLLRGIEREGKPNVKPTLVVYPREDHSFKEYANAEDVLRRLIQHLDSYLK